MTAFSSAHGAYTEAEAAVGRKPLSAPNWIPAECAKQLDAARDTIAQVETTNKCMDAASKRPRKAPRRSQ